MATSKKFGYYIVSKTALYLTLMDSLQSILADKNFTPPDELAAVKDYVKRIYDSPCSVWVKGDSLILSVRNSALSGTIFLERGKLIRACNLNKKLVIRVGY